MPSDEGARPSIWDATAGVPDYPRLSQNQTADVCVIGAGIAGLTTAYHLARAGRNVIVIDDGPIAGGETGRTTAHLATAVDDYYHEIERLHGDRAARLVAEAFRGAVDRIEEIVRDEHIDCDFARLDGWWIPAGDDGRELLERELDAARRLGFDDVELVHEWPLAQSFPGPALRFPRQGQFHILRYMDGLARAAERRGARIFSGAHVVDVTDGSPCTVRTSTGLVITAADVVVATNTPINDRFTIHTKQAPYRTYVIAATIARGAVPLGLYWDTLDPYHYVRHFDPLGDEGDDFLIVGGEDHKTGQPDGHEADRFDSLERWARAHFPIGEVRHRWSGQVMEPVDCLAYIGLNPGDRRVWIATGDSGNGMTHGTLAGMLLTDLLVGLEPAWAEPFAPSRVSFTPSATKEFLLENLNVARQYLDWLTPGEAREVSAVPAGEGRVIRHGGAKLAVHRADDGQLTVRSATCTHLACVVDWNAVEKTWDCPCHGSRFATDGSVINGPAITPLAEVDPATLEELAAAPGRERDARERPRDEAR